jgi:DNA end-binding protein Ku
MPRVVWKGAISFGLVNIPVNLYPGKREQELSFSMLDKRDMGPIGFQRYNKTTGKPVEWENIVKGYEVESGQYVVMSDEDFRQANPEATQTVDIVSFVDAAAIPPYYFEVPYYLEPGKRGEKGYALLRETLKRSGKAGLAKVVIRTKQHLAVLLPVDNALVLNTVRYADEIIPLSTLELPGGLKDAGVSEKEMQMAERLVDDMTEAWNPEQYTDTYRDDLMRRIEEKVKAGQTDVITEPEKAGAEPGGAKVIDLMALLKQSLDRGGKPKHDGRSGGRADDGGAANDDAAAPAARKPPKRAAERKAKPAKGARAEVRKEPRRKRAA